MYAFIIASVTVPTRRQSTLAPKVLPQYRFPQFPYSDCNTWLLFPLMYCAICETDQLRGDDTSKCT